MLYSFSQEQSAMLLFLTLDIESLGDAINKRKKTILKKIRKNLDKYDVKIKKDDK